MEMIGLAYFSPFVYHLCAHWGRAFKSLCYAEKSDSKSVMSLAENSDRK